MTISDPIVSANFLGLARLVGLSTPSSTYAPGELGVLQADRQGVITMANASALALLNLSECPNGRYAADVFGCPLPLNAHSYTCETLPAGRRQCVQLTVTPLLTGAVVCGYSLLVAPAQEPVADQQYWIQRVMNHASAIVCVRDQEGRYLIMNQVGERLLGLPAGGATGRTDAMFQQPGWEVLQRETDDEMLRLGECAMSVHTVELTSGPVRLVMAKNLIQNELGEVMGSILIGGVLQHSEREKYRFVNPRFIASLSHELRTPLNAVIGFSQLLLEDDLNDDQLDSVATILQSGRHLLSLVEQILNMFSPRHTMARPDSFNLSHMIEDCCSMLTPLAQERGITVDIPDESEMVLYQLEDNLRQVILNLISNAIKYNRRGGRVKVALNVRAERVAITVADNGVGIEKADMDKLFQPFSRLQATAQMAEGTGLGLMITRDLITRMGGRIMVDSTPGQGSLFTVELPVRYQPRLRD